jgi:hypothetical protein
MPSYADAWQACAGPFGSQGEIQTWEQTPTTIWWGIAKLKSTGAPQINRSGPRREPPSAVDSDPRVCGSRFGSRSKRARHRRAYVG